jgi:hypothetical protein
VFPLVLVARRNVGVPGVLLRLVGATLFLLSSPSNTNTYFNCNYGSTQDTHGGSLISSLSHSPVTRQVHPTVPTVDRPNQNTHSSNALHCSKARLSPVHPKQQPNQHNDQPKQHRPSHTLLVGPTRILSISHGNCPLSGVRVSIINSTVSCILPRSSIPSLQYQPTT